MGFLVVAVPVLQPGRLLFSVSAAHSGGGKELVAGDEVSLAGAVVLGVGFVAFGGDDFCGILGRGANRAP